MAARDYHGAILLAGGIYGNWQAFCALLEAARAHSIPPQNIILTGDLAAYCADGEAVATYCRQRMPNTLIVRGNCERTLAAGDADCGCGFERGSICDALSGAWHAHAAATISAANKQWFGQLPAQARINFAQRALAVIHGGEETDNEFIFASTPNKARRIAKLQADGVLAGHCGIPHTSITAGALWHNSGALGMPANDGTPRVWYSTLTDEGAAGIRIRHLPLQYDVPTAQAAMKKAGLPAPYRDCLASGIWPSDSVLPDAEKRQQGHPLRFEEYLWKN